MGFGLFVGRGSYWVLGVVRNIGWILWVFDDCFDMGCGVGIIREEICVYIWCGKCRYGIGDVGGYNGRFEMG